MTLYSLRPTCSRFLFLVTVLILGFSCSEAHHSSYGLKQIEGYYSPNDHPHYNYNNSNACHETANQNISLLKQNGETSTEYLLGYSTWLVAAQTTSVTLGAQIFIYYVYINGEWQEFKPSTLIMNGQIVATRMVANHKNPISTFKASGLTTVGDSRFDAEIPLAHRYMLHTMPYNVDQLSALSPETRANLKQALGRRHLYGSPSEFSYLKVVRMVFDLAPYRSCIALYGRYGPGSQKGLHLVVSEGLLNALSIRR